MTPRSSFLSDLIDAPKRLLIASVRGYRFAISPWLGSSCRFEPSCSAYAMEALQRHGALDGTLFTAGRVLRCHPWCKGGRDDVPAPGHGLLTRLLDNAAGRKSGRASRAPHSLPSAEENFP